MYTSIHIFKYIFYFVGNLLQVRRPDIHLSTINGFESEKNMICKLSQFSLYLENAFELSLDTFEYFE